MFIIWIFLLSNLEHTPSTDTKASSESEHSEVETEFEQLIITQRKMLTDAVTSRALHANAWVKLISYLLQSKFLGLCVLPGNWLWEIPDKGGLHSAWQQWYARTLTSEPGKGLLLSQLIPPGYSLAGSFQVFSGIPFTPFPTVLPYIHPSGFSTRQVYPNKPLLTPSAPSPLPVQAGRVHPPVSPRGHLQISIMTPNLPYYNWYCLHIYPNTAELSDRGSAEPGLMRALALRSSCIAPPTPSLTVPAGSWLSQSVLQSSPINSSG